MIKIRAESMLMGCKKQRCEPLAAWDVCVDGLKASTGALNTLFVQPIMASDLFKD